MVGEVSQAYLSLFVTVSPDVRNVWGDFCSKGAEMKAILWVTGVILALAPLACGVFKPV